MSTLTQFDILTSRSVYGCGQACMRRRWWSHEAPNPSGGHGWERKRLSVPLTTGRHVHAGVAQLCNFAKCLGSADIEAAMADAITLDSVGSVDIAVKLALDVYWAEVKERGLEEEAGTDGAFLAAEQAALVEAIVRAWARVRLPRLLAEYDIVDVEREELADLGGGVGLQTRSDAILRRHTDGAIFIYNPKTVADAGERWQKQWEVDMQLMTEVLAVEQRLGERVMGVIIDGFLKGSRRREHANDPQSPKRQASPLIYGYKLDADPPLHKADYTHEYTRARGWHRFQVWENDFGAESISRQPDGTITTVQDSPIAAWVAWLPEEVVAAQFFTLPPIYRNPAAMQSVGTQIRYAEQDIKRRVDEVALGRASLDATFAQNFHSCTWPSQCEMHDACHTGGVADALVQLDGSGLYQARQPNHPTEEG